jgi:hypothetical protein
MAIFVAYSQSSAVLGQQDKHSAAHNDADEIFKDQVVLVEMLPPGDEAYGSVAVTDAHIVKLGQRDFIVGDGYAPKESEAAEWLSDVLVSVPCDQISRLESMTPERYKEYLKSWKDNPRK